MDKLLVVDDSALMRRCLKAIFESDGSFEVVTARNGADALTQIDTHNPAVITLDINMPEMDGLTCLAQIMASVPRPVVMVSSLTARGAQATLEALELGAVDFIEKPGGTVSLNIDAISGPLLSKVKAASRAKPRRAKGLVDRIRRAKEPGPVRPRRGATSTADGLVLIGVSTGGPRTLEDVLPELPGDFPWPVIIAQHMPGPFTASFAARLNQLCDLEVVEVSGPMPLRRGQIYIARGGADVIVSSRLNRLIVDSVAEEPQYLWHPSIERLVRSAFSSLDPERLIAVQLTGMGNDGADAITELRQKGGHTIAEHESTAIVYGMPAEVVRRGGADKILPSDRIAAQLTEWVA